MKNKALALELLNDMNSFINDLVDEFGTEGTISHDTFNKAVELKYRVIADSDLWDSDPNSNNHSECNKHIVTQRSELLAFIKFYDNLTDKEKSYPKEDIVEIFLKANCA